MLLTFLNPTTPLWILFVIVENEANVETVPSLSYAILEILAWFGKRHVLYFQDCVGFTNSFNFLPILKSRW